MRRGLHRPRYAGRYDALTGIYNRRYMDERLTQLVKTLSRAGGKLSVMMIDIDFFKILECGEDFQEDCANLTFNMVMIEG